MRILQKFILVFGLAGVMVAVVGFTGYLKLEEAENKVGAVVKIGPNINSYHKIRFYGEAIASASAEMLMHATLGYKPHQNNNEMHVELFFEANESCSEYIALQRETISEHYGFVEQNFPYELEMVNEISQAAKELEDVATAIMNTGYSNVTNKDVDSLHLKLADASKNILSITQRAIAHEENEQREIHKSMDVILDESIRNAVIAGVILLLIVVFLWVFIARKIVMPLVEMRKATKNISKQDFDFRIKVDASDEMGDLANAFNEMIVQLGETTVSRDYVEDVLRSISDALFVLDNKGVINRVNDSAVRLLSYSKQELIDQNAEIIIPEKDQLGGMFQWLMEQPSLNGREAVLVSKQGKEIAVYLTSSQLHNAEGEVQGLIILAQDIGARKEAERHLHYLANFDPLTGLSNRAMLFERLADAISQPIRDRKDVGLLLCGLDRFKLINDTLGHEAGDQLLKMMAKRLQGVVTLGHEAGDQLLKMMAKRLQGVVRSCDTVARIGGDEFAVVMPEVNSVEDVIETAEKVIGTLAGLVDIADQEVFITTTVGVSLYPHDGIEPLTLLKNADIALCDAKNKGKNQFVFYSDVSGAKSTEYLKLESDLQHALERDEIKVYFQPQVDIERRLIVGAEALVRWEHPERGLVSPGVFLPIAEETGLMVAIGERVLRVACAKAKEWNDMGYQDFKIAVNLSDQEFKRKDLLQLVNEIFDATELKPENLDLEITENIVMHNSKAAESIMRSLRDLGLELSIDDFGTGYSSLSHLKRFPVNTVKIDRSFIMDVVEDEDDKAIVGAILGIAKKMKLNVVAEGVETLEQRDFLRENDCINIQGFLYSKPLPDTEFTELLAKQASLFVDNQA
jgi:PAS domain S-box-containing protein